MSWVQTCGSPLTVAPASKGTDGSVVVVVRGSADIHCAEAFEASLADVLAIRPRLVVLDLRGVDILTSVAIGVLVGFRTRLMGMGGKVVAARVPEPIAKTMRFTRVTELFPQFATADDARASVKRL